MTSLLAVFLNTGQEVYLKYYLVVTWLVPRETAAVSAHALCSLYTHASVYSVPLFEATLPSLISAHGCPKADSPTESSNGLEQVVQHAEAGQTADEGVGVADIPLTAVIELHHL